MRAEELENVVRAVLEMDDLVEGLDQRVEWVEEEMVLARVGCERRVFELEGDLIALRERVVLVEMEG